MFHRASDSALLFREYTVYRNWFSLRQADLVLMDNINKCEAKTQQKAKLAGMRENEVEIAWVHESRFE
jgi:hypothetical protein